MTVPLVVANWKMHGTRAECFALAQKIAAGMSGVAEQAEVAIAPPYTALAAVQAAIEKTRIRLAAQNCHWEGSGAYTGEVSLPMLAEIGCDSVIIGHSERRHILHENDGWIAQKVSAALRNRFRPILCVGETLDERRRGRTAGVIANQLKIALKGVAKTAIDNVEIAYEPVWAIGTGQNATPEQIQKVHERIRRDLVRRFGSRNGKRVRILYGGSVKPENAAELMSTAEVNGLLVGGASLNPDAFLSIVRAAARQ